jgi:hypothetical protein
METEDISINYFGKELKMRIYNYDYYKERNLVNDGLDIISWCLKTPDNCWEPYQTELTKEILKDGNNIFIDIGSHLGWYSLLAASLNNNVYCIDVNDNTSEIFLHNVKINNFEDKIKFFKQFVDENFNLNNILPRDKHIRLIKCDIEGYEIEFSEKILDRLEDKTIDYLILEISPNFRDNYHETVFKIKNLGYDIYNIGLSHQRKLDDSTTMMSLKDKLVDINNLEEMRAYINNVEYGQTNFLFTHLKI